MNGLENLAQHLGGLNLSSPAQAKAGELGDLLKTIGDLQGEQSTGIHIAKTSAPVTNEKLNDAAMRLSHPGEINVIM